jgi:hypothetical protein
MVESPLVDILTFFGWGEVLANGPRLPAGVAVVDELTMTKYIC